MAGLRSYGDPCGIARALDLVGERWALLIVRELVLGPKRFTDLKRALEDASPNVLSQRLDELETGGVVQRSQVGPANYALTPYGEKLHPLLVQLGAWGAQSTARPKGQLSLDALVVALESTWQGRDLTGTIALDVEGVGCQVELRGRGLEVRRGEPKRPDARLITDRSNLRATVFGDPSAKPIVIEGDRRLAKRFLASFARPAQAVR